MNSQSLPDTDFLATLLDPYFAIAGIFGIPIFVIIILYTTYHLIKAQRLFNLLLFFIFLALFLHPWGRFAIAAVGITILVINNCFYFYYFINSFFKQKVTPIALNKNSPTVSILIPAKNEETVIAETLQSISKLTYPLDKIEIIVIDDNSTDSTHAICKYLMNQIPNLNIQYNAVSKGKSTALNDAANSIQSEYFLILDADHHIDADFIQTALAHFNDPTVSCVQGANTIRNNKRNLLCACIDMEFLGRFKSCYPGRKTAFFMGSGGIFKTKDFKAIGGFNPEMLTEDLEISFRLYNTGKRLVYDGTISTHELAVENLKAFYKQRHRWLRGIWQSFAFHFKKTIVPNEHFIKVRIPFIHFMIECFSLPVLLILCILYSFNALGVIDFQFKLFIYITTLMSVIVFDAGYIRGRRYYLLLLGPILLFYMLLYALPSSIAWIDNVLLKKPYVWVKTARPGQKKSKSILANEPSLAFAPQTKSIQR